MKLYKVNICGIPHTVILRKDDFDSDATHFGQIDYKSAVIKINEDVSSEQREETLCHEILHGILMHIGRQDLGTDEQLVSVLGNAINQSFLVKKEMIV